MAMPELDEETLDAMLGLSTVPEERAELENQRKMAMLLGKGAIGYNPYVGRGGGSRANIGGFANALAQGIQGYKSGKIDRSTTAGDAAIRDRERANRAKWFRARYGNRQGGAAGGLDTAQPSAMFDPGQPDVRVLPPDEEELPYG